MSPFFHDPISVSATFARRDDLYDDQAVYFKGLIEFIRDVDSGHS